MHYAQYPDRPRLPRPVAGIDPLPEIWGLSNRDEERFEHKGYQGYPGPTSGWPSTTGVYWPHSMENRTRAAPGACRGRARPAHG